MHQDEEKTMEKQRLDVQYPVEYTEYKIGRVTYRVKSVFEGERDAVECLSVLMLRSLEAKAS